MRHGDAGFDVDVISNQGSDAAMMRVEAARRIFPRCWFNETTTQAGLEALGFYHERKDDAQRRAWASTRLVEPCVRFLWPYGGRVRGAAGKSASSESSGLFFSPIRRNALVGITMQQTPVARAARKNA
jgi:hypothetical protein